MSYIFNNCFLSFFDSIFEEDRVDDLYLPLVVAHRGYSSQHPENTMEAFIAARDSGADMIELDVQLTKDNVLVIFHYFSLFLLKMRMFSSL